METRNEDSVLPGQFVVDGFSVLHTLDRNCLAGGMLFVREDIPSNLLTIEEKKLGSFYVELNLRNNKWLVNCSNNPHKNNTGIHLDSHINPLCTNPTKWPNALKQFAGHLKG